eukprot:3583192-Rhodomonas_salina.1
MHDGNVADHGHTAPGAQVPLDVSMTVITCEGWAGELGRQDGSGHDGGGLELLPHGQHVLMTSVEGRSGV